MTTSRRETLRTIMQMAWSWRRAVGCSMADALRTAWRKAKQAAAPVQPIVYLKSPILSPTSNRFAGQRYGRVRDWQAGRQVAGW